MVGLLLAMALTIQSAETEAIAVAFLDWERCTETYAGRWGSSPEPVATVVEASMGACIGALDEAKTKMRGLEGGTVFDMEQVDAYAMERRGNQRSRLTAFVLDARMRGK